MRQNCLKLEAVPKNVYQALNAQKKDFKTIKEFYKDINNMKHFLKDGCQEFNNNFELLNFINSGTSPNPNIKKNEKFSSLPQDGSKLLVNDMHQSFYNIVKTIIYIQSHFRGYAVKKKLLINYLSRSYFTKKSIEKIINIQKIVRSFLSKINLRKKIIIELINKKRKNSINLIIKKLHDYISIIKVKKTILINYCLEQRKLKAIFLQQSFRNYLFYKSFQKLRQEI